MSLFIRSRFTRTVIAWVHWRLALRWAAALSLALLLLPLPVWAYPGQGLLEYARSYFIAPLGGMALIVTLCGAMFRPEMVKSGIWCAVICAFIFAVISAMPTIIGIMQSS